VNLALEKRFLSPLGGKLVRYPLGRKQYNGRVERSHRTDDKEFYRPYLLDPLSTDLLLSFDSEGGNDLLAQIGIHIANRPELCYNTTNTGQGGRLLSAESTPALKYISQRDEEGRCKDPPFLLPEPRCQIPPS